MTFQAKEFTLEWAKAAAIRAIKTGAQTALSMFVVGQMLSEVNWTAVCSCAVVAMIFSILTSLTGLPEVGSDGKLIVDLSEKENGVLKFNVDVTPEQLNALETKEKVMLEVDKTAFASIE